MRALLATLIVARVSAAVFNISNVFSDNAVLQRDKPVRVWGFADAGTNVSSEWVDGTTYFGQADESQVWRVEFPATPMHATPFNLTFSASPAGGGAPTNLTLAGLLLGDVFLCSGQSNVCAVEVVAMYNASDLVAAAANMPLLRIAAVDPSTNSSVPLSEWPAQNLLPWQAPLGPNNNQNASLLTFSAVCYIMGATLYTEYLNSSVPVGLIESAHGGSSLQAWQSPDAVGACGDPPNLWPSSIMYNSNFHPLTVGPASLAGIYWYQGEEDCGIGSTESYYRADWYGCALPATIADWRSKLGDPSLFFLVQQLHAWLHTDDAGLAIMRQAQMKALVLPYTGYSTAFDGGDPASLWLVSPAAQCTAI